MRYEPRGLDRWANTDTSLHFNEPVERYRHQPNRWQGAWIYCLSKGDEESAHLIRLRNDERYAERCEQEAASVFPVTSPAIKSLREIQSERDALEAA